MTCLTELYGIVLAVALFYATATYLRLLFIDSVVSREHHDSLFMPVSKTLKRRLARTGRSHPSLYLLRGCSHVSSWLC